MADGFDIHIGAEQASHLAVAAKALGVRPEDYARELLEAALDREDPWAVSQARLEKYDQAGNSIPLDKALADFSADLEAKLAAQKI